MNATKLSPAQLTIRDARNAEAARLSTRLAACDAERAALAYSYTGDEATDAAIDARREALASEADALTTARWAIPTSDRGDVAYIRECRARKLSLDTI